MAKRQEPQPTKATLKGWAEIAKYLSQPVSTVHHWADTGMPVGRSGRYVVAEPQELDRWLGRESGLKQPAHIAHDAESDLTGELRQALRAVRHRK